MSEYMLEAASGPREGHGKRGHGHAFYRVFTYVLITIHPVFCTLNLHKLSARYVVSPPTRGYLRVISEYLLEAASGARGGHGKRGHGLFYHVFSLGIITITSE